MRVVLTRHTIGPTRPIALGVTFRLRALACDPLGLPHSLLPRRSTKRVFHLLGRLAIRS